MVRLLAIKKWRNLLEKAEYPFIIWTDQKNLACIQAAKHLNTSHQQVCWALFFGQLRFTLTYHMGSKNSTSNALSHQHACESTPSSLDTIIPSSCIMNTVKNSRQTQPILAMAPQATSLSLIQSALKSYHGSMCPILPGTLGPIAPIPSWSDIEYVFEFPTLAAGSGWNEPALKATFHEGFN